MTVTQRSRYSSTSAPDDEPTPPRPGTTAAGVVAVALLLGAGAFALAGGEQPPTKPAAATPAAAAAPSPTAIPPAGPSRASAASGEQEPLLVAPQVQWQLFAGVALPYGSTAGPLEADGPLYRRYERSQAGALIAAVQLGTRYLLTPGDGWREVLEQQVLPGAGRDAFARNRATVDEQDPPGTYGQIAGFRMLAFTTDVAAVQLVSRFPATGRLQVVSVTVKWVAGDWRLQLQPDGGTSPTAQAVDDLDGFVVWSA